MGNITEHCKGCEKIDEDENCIVYPNPSIQMRWASLPDLRKKTMTGCSFNYDNIVEPETAKGKKRVGQQKQKRRRK